MLLISKSLTSTLFNFILLAGGKNKSLFNGKKSYFYSSEHSKLFDIAVNVNSLLRA